MKGGEEGREEGSEGRRGVKGGEEGREEGSEGRGGR